jgi:hypothetical protein
VQWLLLVQLLLVKLASKGKRLMPVKLLNMPLLLFVQLPSNEKRCCCSCSWACLCSSLRKKAAARTVAARIKGIAAAVREAATRTADLLVARATASHGAAKHTAAAVGEAAAREARFKGKTATARDAATCAAAAREATWSLMWLLLVLLLNMPLLLFVHLSLVVQFVPTKSGCTCSC